MFIWTEQKKKQQTLNTEDGETRESLKEVYV